MFGLFRKEPLPERLRYEDSCRRLQPRHLEPGPIPPLPDRMPHPEDSLLGVSFFRTLLEDADDLCNLTLPGSFFGRGEIRRSSFRNTDLSASFMCWNDFNEVDFTDAVLAGADLRASRFVRVRFDSADLSGADLRQSGVEHCVFTKATMYDTVLTHAQGTRLVLSAAQRARIAWTDHDGPEPPGG